MNQDYLDFDHPPPRRTAVLATPADPELLRRSKESALKQLLTQLTGQADQHTVRSHDELAAAERFLQRLKQFRDEVAALYDPIIAANYRAHKTSCDLRNALDKPAELAFRNLKARMVSFLNEIDRQRREEQQAALAAAERQQQTLRAQAPATAPGPIALPAAFVPPPVHTSDVRLQNSSVKRIWTYEVEDLGALVAGVAAGTVPLEALCVNDKHVCEKVSQLRTALRYPGIRVFQSNQIAVR